MSSSYAERLKKRAKDDVPPIPVAPTGSYRFRVVGKGRLRDSRSENERAPDAFLSYSVRIVKPVEVDEDELQAAVEEQGYASADEMFARWKGFIEFPIWSPKGDQTEEEVIDALRRSVIRILSLSNPRATLEELMEEAEGAECIGEMEKTETSDGPRNYALGTRDLAPVPDLS